MVACVPTLEGSMYLTDPQSIIAYILRRYFRQPKDTVPILGDLIISLPWQVARFGKQPDLLVTNIQEDLQNCLTRIFGGERKITVSANYTNDSTTTYEVTISVIYTTVGKEISQLGSTISLKNGRLVIPEDTLANLSQLIKTS